MAMPKQMLKWRAKQPEGAIMEPETFKAIERKAARNPKVKNPKKVAGAAYWQSVRAKYKESKK